MTLSFDAEALVREYTPVLVLYPEIPEGSIRQTNPDYPHASPMLHDYHPRDIRLMLEHSTLDRWFRFGAGQPHTWQGTLEAMEQDSYEHDLDLVPRTQPTDRDAFWKYYANLPKDRPDFQRACYARVVPGFGINQDRILVQFWYAYFYNDFWNTHEMDWEAINLVFKLANPRPLPTICAVSAHKGGFWLPWSRVEKAEVDPDTGLPVSSLGGTHPVIYVASGSHANYFYGPALYVTAPPLVTMASDLLKESRKLVDYTTNWEDGSVQLVEAQLIPPAPNNLWSGNWRWLNLKGRWGSRGKWYDFEFGDSGPLGFTNCGDPWQYPFRWIDTSFTRAPSRLEAVMPTLVEPGAA